MKKSTVILTVIVIILIALLFFCAMAIIQQFNDFEEQKIKRYAEYDDNNNYCMAKGVRMYPVSKSLTYTNKYNCCLDCELVNMNFFKFEEHFWQDDCYCHKNNIITQVW